MAVLDNLDHPSHETRRCATVFCLTWIGFFAVLGAITYLVSLL